MTRIFEISSPNRLLLRLKAEHAALYHIDELAHNLSADEAELLHLQLTRFLQSHQAEIRLLQSAPHDYLKTLNRLGLTQYEKYFYEKNLDEWEAPQLSLYQLCPLAQVGNKTFIQALQRAFEGDSLVQQSPEAEFQELKALAGELFDAQHWYLVKHQGQTIGLILPQIYPDQRNMGTLFYLGVFAEARCQGHGLNLHHLGLKELKLRGCQRYVGSTDTRNQAMQRVFEKQKCQLTQSLTFYAAPESSQK